MNQENRLIIVASFYFFNEFKMILDNKTLPNLISKWMVIFKVHIEHNF